MSHPYDYADNLVDELLNPMSNSVPLTPFVSFPRIPRLSRECIITEKIDGTNAQIFVSEDGKHLLTGSRNRWITPENDNYGFARWVGLHHDELLTLGPGHHFGEWWGAGIQRRYGVPDKIFSLFNVARWVSKKYAVGLRFENSNQSVVPDCCSVVPMLYVGEFDTARIASTLAHLAETGSVAAPGFMQPEGIVIYHVAAKQYFKKTIEHDAQGKPE